MIIIKIQQELKDDIIIDLLTTAIEGGSTYWCEGIYQTAGFTPEKGKGPWYACPEQMAAKDFVIQVVEQEAHDDSGNIIHIVNRDKMIKALELMGNYGTPKGFHLRDVIEENWDAETADVWLQMAAFGEVVYG